MPHRNRRMSKKLGLGPGTLVYIGEHRPEKVSIDIIEIEADRLKEARTGRVEDCRPYRDSKGMTWLNVNGIHDLHIVKTLGDHFGIHELLLEDIVNSAHRPGADESDDQIALVLKMLYFEHGSDELKSEQVSVIFGRRWVISFQEREGDVFGPVRERIRKTVPRERFLGADYLAYSLVDAIVDHYYPILERLGERIEAIEEKLVEHPTRADLSELYSVRRDLAAMRKLVWPMRDVVGALIRSESKLYHDYTRPYLRDLYEHVIQVIDTLETYRETAASLLDVYLSSVSNRMNEVMKVLTIIATIFIPLSFLAGVYGMNFDTRSPFNMPELSARYGYIVFWIVALAVGGGLLLFFRRKRWL